MASGWEKINKLFRRRMALWFMIFDKCLSTQPQSVEICRRIPIASVEGKFACQSINALPFDNCMKWNLKSKIPPHTTTSLTPAPFLATQFQFQFQFEWIASLFDTFTFAWLCLWFGHSFAPKIPSCTACEYRLSCPCFFFYSIIVIWQWRCSSSGSSPVLDTGSSILECQPKFIGLGLVGGAWNWARDWGGWDWE